MLATTGSESFLARHAYCGRRTPAELLARLRSAPGAIVGDLEQDMPDAIRRQRLRWLAANRQQQSQTTGPRNIPEMGS